LRIIILSDHDVLEGKQTSSVAIRQISLAGILKHSHELTVATTYGRKKNIKKNGIRIISGLKSINLIDDFDVVLIELSSSTSSIAYLYATSSYNKPTIVDSHYSIIFEKLVSLSNKDSGVYEQKLQVISKIIEKGDHYICATPKLRDYYLGIISLIGKINHNTFNTELVSTIPNIFETNFSSNKRVLRKQYFKKNDKVIISLGAIYPWFSPTPVIAAMPMILSRVEDAKLLILGGKHPSGFYAEGYNNAVQLSKKLNLYRRSVHFLNWVTKEESYAYTSEADLSVLISKDSLEDEFAYRTRTLTPLLLGIPTVTNGSDYISRLIHNYQAGVVLPNESPQTISRELTKLLLDKKLHRKAKRNTKMVITHIKRDINVKPLIKFLENPKIYPIVSKPQMIRRHFNQAKSNIFTFLNQKHFK